MTHRADPWAFHPHPAAWAVVVGVALAYLLALHLVPASSRARPTRRQWSSLAGGLLTLAVALTWPLADLAAHWSLTALLAQRLLITLAAAPLLLLAVPAPVLARLTRPAPIDAVLDFVTRPVVAVAAFSAIAVGTLASPVVAEQSSSALARGGIDALLLAGGGLLWGPVLRNIPGAHRPGSLGVAVYLFVQSIVPTFPAVIFIFARHPIYPAFAAVHRALGVSALADQQISGVMAKVATLPVLWTAAWVAMARAQAADREGRDVEPLTWAEVERQLERASRSEARRRAHPRRQRVSAIPRPAPGGGWLPPGDTQSPGGPTQGSGPAPGDP
ncbi:MAG TPA: cytochrome c oxidase assembly protein [Acidimicrobiales bacterium]|nr:cytochrome c oxidase assembly protein [Acidimicrobiales bacterium]